MTEQEFQDLVAQYPSVKRINASNMQQHGLVTSGEYSAAKTRANILLRTPLIVKIQALPMARIRSLFAHNAVRFIMDTHEYYPSGRLCYSIPLFVSQEPHFIGPDAHLMIYHYALVNNELIEIPKVINGLMDESITWKDALYLAKLKTEDIKRCMQANGLDLPDYTNKLSKWFERHNLAFRQQLHNKYNADPAMLFSKLMPFLSLAEQAKLSEVCKVEKVDPNVVKNARECCLCIFQ